MPARNTNAFEHALHELQTGSATALVRQIHNLFSAISTLTVDEVLAAHQTMSFIEAGASDFRLLAQVQKVKKAIETRMDQLAAEAGAKDVREGFRLRLMFPQRRHG